MRVEGGGAQCAENYDHSDAQVMYPICALASANNLGVSAEGRGGGARDTNRTV